MLAECKMSTYFKNYCYPKCRVLLSGVPCCDFPARCHHKGPFTKDVRLKSGFLDPLPPAST